MADDADLHRAGGGTWSETTVRVPGADSSVSSAPMRAARSRIIRMPTPSRGACPLPLSAPPLSSTAQMDVERRALQADQDRRPPVAGGVHRRLPRDLEDGRVAVLLGFPAAARAVERRRDAVLLVHRLGQRAECLDEPLLLHHDRVQARHGSAQVVGGVGREPFQPPEHLLGMVDVALRDRVADDVAHEPHRGERLLWPVVQTVGERLALGVDGVQHVVEELALLARRARRGRRCRPGSTTRSLRRRPRRRPP